MSKQKHNSCGINYNNNDSGSFENNASFIISFKSNFNLKTNYNKSQFQHLSDTKRSELYYENLNNGQKI